MHARLWPTTLGVLLAAMASRALPSQAPMVFEPLSGVLIVKAFVFPPPVM